MIQDHRMRPVASVHPSLFATVDQRVEESTEIWARGLASLFGHAKERFGDVSWETQAGGDRIWGHKAIIYARAPKTFKDRYFLTRPFSRSPTLRSPSPASLHPTSSLFPSSRPISPTSSRGASSLSVRTPSFSGSGVTIRPGSSAEPGETLRLTHGDTPELFQAQLEWLYTGEGFGDVVEWISQDEAIPLEASIRDSQGRRGDQRDRRDKLGQDLTYMWRSKLYVDVRIRLDTHSLPSAEDTASDSDDSTNSLSSTAVFTAHRFILVSRSPYFASLLLNTSSFLSPNLSTNGIFDINLPTPPFTPASLHFCLGYIYAGHLDFSNRTFDLTTIFQIYRAALYLQLDGLMEEAIARIVWDFCHGLDYSRCHCRKCMMRIGGVWRFAQEEDVGNMELSAAARQFLIVTWGESWGKEVGLSTLDQRNDLVRGVRSNLSAQNVISAFRSIGQLRAKMDTGIRTKGVSAAAWVDALGVMVDQIIESARETLVRDFEKVADGKELWQLLDGGGFSVDLLESVLKELVDCLGTIQKCIEAPRIYQIIVSSILLKTDPEAMHTVLPLRSRGRQLVEVAKEGIVVHIKRRWLHIRESGGFQGLEIWAIKEIADAIEVSDDELFTSVSTPRPTSQTTRLGMTRTTSKALSLADTSSLRSTTSVRPLRTATHPPTLVENNAEVPGLRRLRLSSSASSSSAVSAQSSRPRVSSSLATTPPSMIGPRARSPTAARRGNRVNIGVSGRGSQPVSETSRGPSRTGETITEDSNGTSVVKRGTMSGGIRPLVSRGSLASTSTLNMREKEKNGVASSSTSRAATPIRVNPTTPTLSNPTTPTSVSSGRKSSASVRPIASGSKLPPVSKPLTPLVPTARTRAASLASTRTSRSVNKVTITPLPPATPKIPDGQVSSSAGPSGSAVNGSSSASSSRTRTQSQTTTTSTATRSRPSSNASTIRRPLHVPSPPVPPVPRVPGASAQKSQLGVRSPPSSKNAVVPAPAVMTPLSSSSSTIEDPDARTPETSDMDDLPSHPPTKAHIPKLSPPSKTPFPPIQIPRPNRKISTSSVRSHEHPTSAFDPPRRQRLPSLLPRPALTIKDGTKPFMGKGISLRVGIPCIVSLEGKRARFRAQVKYLGYMDNSKDPWVGIESEDLTRFGVETLPAGSQGGFHYFDLTPPLMEKKSVGLGADLALNAKERTSGRGTQRSVSPFVLPTGPGGGEDWMVSEELRALFVRPREVVYVVGAE